MTPGDFTNQVHDFDPGIEDYPNGLFWTLPVAAGAVTANPGAGRGSLVVANQAMRDFFDIPNALFRFEDPVSLPATVSYNLEWTGPVTERQNFRDATNRWAGEFAKTSATMSWSASRPDGFSFTSDAASTSHSRDAVIGTERNGRFF